MKKLARGVRPVGISFAHAVASPEIRATISQVSVPVTGKGSLHANGVDAQTFKEMVEAKLQLSLADGVQPILNNRLLNSLQFNVGGIAAEEVSL